MDARLATTLALALARAIHTPAQPGVATFRAPAGAEETLPPIARASAPSSRVDSSRERSGPLMRAESEELTADPGFIAGTLEMVAWGQTRAEELAEWPADRGTVSLD